MLLFRTLSLILASAVFALGALADPIDYDRLRERLELLSEMPEMVGLAVAVVENGDVTFAEGFGETHIDGLPVTVNTQFRWASLSKGVAGSVTGQLTQDGLLSFDDTVASYDTSLRLPNRAERRASIGQVLSHQLGIVNNAYDLRLEDGWEAPAIRRTLGSLKSVCAIGECHSYQNVAFDTVSEIVEETTGATYADIAMSRLFTPLGMDTASLTRKGLKSGGDWARPYRGRRGRTRPALQTVNDSYYNVPAAGGVNSSILDLAEYMRAQMGLYPDIISQDTLDTIHTPRIRTLREQRSQNRRYGGRLKQASYGYGWRVYDYDGVHRVIGHRGAVRGYRAMILFDPERDTGVVALWNSSSRKPVGIQLEVMDMVYGLPPTDWIGLNNGSGNRSRASR